ncbi:hypothetical protein M758_4G043600 [Ceratodon purpureus]|nr:hypothetical protein M758_4G043600 [Ceratodon purpureus]
MSLVNHELFNIWFPAIVGGLIIGLVAAALWGILRRKTWTFASRFWPGVLEEVGLDQSSTLSRTEAEERQQEVTRMLAALSSQISTALAKPPDKSLMAEAVDLTVAGSSNSPKDFDVEAQIGINPLYSSTSKPRTFTVTAYFPDDTPKIIVRRTHIVFKRYARGTIKRWKSSIVVQASLPVDPCVLTEIGELAKDCMHAENRCTFQLGNWAILYYNAGKAQFRALTEGDVPVNVEARWQENGAGITMSGLYLNGAQVKVATEQTSAILRDNGPASQGSGDLDELFFPNEEVEVPEQDSLIYAAKVVQADGMSLTVRSEASCILPPREKSLREIMWDRLQWISLSARKMIKSLLKFEDGQPEVSSSGRSLESDLEHFELLAEHWKGVSEIQLLDTRNEALYYLHKLPEFVIDESAGPQPSHLFTTIVIGGQHHLKYWQRGLRDLNEVILFWNCPQNTDGLQCGLHISVRGRIKFLLGDFEGALQDFDLACNLNTGEHGSTVLLDRALAKCLLARYSEAMQDVLAIIAINPNLNEIQKLKTCLQQILSYQLSFGRVHRQYHGSFSQRPQLPDQHKFPLQVPTIPDLLTGDEWHSASQDVARTPDGHDHSNRVIRACDLRSGDLANSRNVKMGEGEGCCKLESAKTPLLAKSTFWSRDSEDFPRALNRATSFENLLQFHSHPSNIVTRSRSSLGDNSSGDQLCHLRSPTCRAPYRTLNSQRGRPPNGSRQGAAGFKGVRMRKGVRGYLVEIRPPKWKRTIWLGTYNTDREAAGAYDAGIFYTNKKTKYNFPELEATFPPLPPHLRLYRTEDSEEIKTFVQKEARLAAQRVKAQPETNTGLAIPPADDQEWFNDWSRNYHDSIQAHSLFDDFLGHGGFQHVNQQIPGRSGFPKQEIPMALDDNLISLIDDDELMPGFPNSDDLHMMTNFETKQEVTSSGEESSECHDDGESGILQELSPDRRRVFRVFSEHEQHTSELAMEIDYT